MGVEIDYMELDGIGRYGIKTGNALGAGKTFDEALMGFVEGLLIQKAPDRLARLRKDLAIAGDRRDWDEANRLEKQIEEQENKPDPEAAQRMLG